jgi:AhpD family alkylhydroperoxidase
MNNGNQEILLKETHNTTEPFKEFHDAVFKDGALSKKQKELIATAISISLKCSPCISTHTKRAFKLGNTEQEIKEAISVGFLMGGGPAFAYASEAVELLIKLSRGKQKQKNQSIVEGNE